MRIAVIGGDGIGPEVIGEAIKVLRATVADAAIETTSYDLGAQRYVETARELFGVVAHAVTERQEIGPREQRECAQEVHA